MKRLYIQPDNPQPRQIDALVDLIKRGELIVIPTETAYMLAGAVGDKKVLDDLKALRGLDDDHQFTILCRDLSELGNFAKVNNHQYRFLKNVTPNPVTFVLQATREVPKRLMHPKKKTIGIRVTDHPIACALLERLGEPLLISSLILPDHADADLPIDDPELIIDLTDRYVSAVVDAGIQPRTQTTVVDLTEDVPMMIREGIVSAEELGL